MQHRPVRRSLARMSRICAVAWALIAAGCATVPVHPTAPAARVGAAPVRFDAAAATLTGDVSADAASTIAAYTAARLQTLVGTDDGAIAPTTIAVVGGFDLDGSTHVRITTTVPGGEVVVTEEVLERAPPQRAKPPPRASAPSEPVRSLPERDVAFFGAVGQLVLLPIVAVAVPVALVLVLAAGYGVVLVAASPLGVLLLVGGVAALCVVAGGTIAVAGVVMNAVAEKQWSDAYDGLLRLHAARVAGVADGAVEPIAR